jgi:hypothetical protein
MKTKELGDRIAVNKLISDVRINAEHAGVKPVGLNAALWRYMDLSKFVAMLAMNKLPLIRVDKLGDEYEGFVPQLPEQAYQGFFRDKDLQNDRRIRSGAENAREYFYASCWHGNDEESDAMWKVYTKAEGLAIRTTYKSLVSSLTGAKESFVVGNVRYGELPPGHTMLQACMTKRTPFEHEQEVRVIWHDERSEQSGASGDALPICTGVTCDFGKLIERVYIGPRASQWFMDAINDLLDKYGLENVRAIPSDLSRKPRWSSRKKTSTTGTGRAARTK